VIHNDYTFSFVGRLWVAIKASAMQISNLRRLIQAILIGDKTVATWSLSCWQCVPG
jgi:hypothetical protein